MSAPAPRGSTVEEERARLKAFKESLERVDALTDKAVDMMDSFEARIRTLENSIDPIRQSNTNHVKIYDNVDHTLISVEKILASFDYVNAEGQIIKKGPDPSNIGAYFQAASRIKEGMEYLSKIKLQSSAKVTGQMLQLLKLAQKSMRQLFQQLLSQNSLPIDPLDYLGKDIPPPTLPSKLLSQMETAAGFIDDGVNDPASSSLVKVYAEVRSKYMHQSIEHLVEAGATQVKRPSTTFEDGASPMVVLLESITFLATVESSFATSILPAELAPVAVDQALTPILETFIDMGESLVGMVKKNLQAEKFCLFAMCESLKVTMHEIERCTNVKVKRERSLLGFKNVMIGVLARSFQDYFEALVATVQRPSNLPPDASIHEVLTDAMNHNRRLLEYMPVMEGLLTSMGDRHWFARIDPKRVPPATNKPKTRSGSAIVRHYMLDILELLEKSVDSNARTYPKRSGLAVPFALNNYHYILKQLQNEPFKTCVGPEIITRFEKHVDSHIKMYGASWKPCADILAEPRSSTMKDRLRQFNASVDEMFRIQSTITISDSDIRKQLVQEVRGRLIPPYTAFVAVCKDGSDPTKSLAKYMKYEVNALEQALTKVIEDPASR